MTFGLMTTYMISNDTEGFLSVLSNPWLITDRGGTSEEWTAEETRVELEEVSDGGFFEPRDLRWDIMEILGHGENMTGGNLSVVNPTIPGDVIIHLNCTTNSDWYVVLRLLDHWMIVEMLPP